MNKDFKQWLKANDYYIIPISEKAIRYWGLYYDEHKLINPTYKWRDITYYSNLNPSKYNNIKYMIQCILDL